MHPVGKLATTVLDCWPVASQITGVQAVYVHAVQVVVFGVHCCVVIGLPPVHPVGKPTTTVLDCWPDAGQIEGVQAVYVQEVQVAGVGFGVHCCEVVGVPPAHPIGDGDEAVLVLTPDASQSDQAEYVQELQVGICGLQVTVSVAG
jgi:hypothetical protein